MKQLAFALLVIGAAAGGGLWYWQKAQVPTASFKIAALHRGDLHVSIGATGTVEPEEVVDIGAQVQGQILSLGSDPQNSTQVVDYGTVVEEGTVLARIDDALYAAEVEQCKASVESAQATQLRAEADLANLKAKLYQAERDFKRANDVRKVGGGSAITDADYDMYQAAFESCKAGLAVGEASVSLAKKNVAMQQAVLKKSKKNLDYCTIQSPVKGVIVDRRVNVGQTVVSSLSAPSLFLIAKDLKKLQVWVSVNEADIGQIRTGQLAPFTVDAFPKEVFQGTVSKIRLNATMTNNVVTYTVEVSTDNSNERLLPYMTANVSFAVSERKEVLLVPNAALRWHPQPAQIVPDARDVIDTGKGRRERGASGTEVTKNQTERGVVWIQEGEMVRPIKVRVGLSDGTQTEVEGEGLMEGAEIVIGEIKAHTGEGQAANPFAPKMFSGKKSQ